jgi:hypothetical protein
MESSSTVATQNVHMKTKIVNLLHQEALEEAAPLGDLHVNTFTIECGRDHDLRILYQSREEWLASSNNNNNDIIIIMLRRAQRKGQQLRLWEC